MNKYILTLFLSFSTISIQSGNTITRVLNKTYTRETIAYFHDAVKSGEIDNIQTFIEAGVDINTLDKNGKTPLHIAIICSNIEIVKLLIKKGANINIQDGCWSYTPLHWAVFKNNTEIVKLLIDKNANLNEQNIYGNTPLHYAVKQGNTQIAQLLLNAGANPDIQMT